MEDIGRTAMRTVGDGRTARSTREESCIARDSASTTRCAQSAMAFAGPYVPGGAGLYALGYPPGYPPGGLAGGLAGFVAFVRPDLAGQI